MLKLSCCPHFQDWTRFGVRSVSASMLCCPIFSRVLCADNSRAIWFVQLYGFGTCRAKRVSPKLLVCFCFCFVFFLQFMALPSMYSIYGLLWSLTVSITTDSSVLKYSALWLLKFVLKYNAFYVMAMYRFGKICEKGNHNLRRNSLIGIIHGYMCHLSVPLSCLKFFRMHYFTDGGSTK